MANTDWLGSLFGSGGAISSIAGSIGGRSGHETNQIEEKLK